MIWVDDSITVTDIRPGQWHGILSLLRDTDLVIRRLADEGKIVSEVGDRLCSWEYALASEAAAKKRVCPCCRGNSFMPVSREDAGVRSVYTYCLVCKLAVAPIVDRDRYYRLEFLPTTVQIPCVPPGPQIAEKLCEARSRGRTGLNYARGGSLPLPLLCPAGPFDRR